MEYNIFCIRMIFPGGPYYDLAGIFELFVHETSQSDFEVMQKVVLKTYISRLVLTFILKFNP